MPHQRVGAFVGTGVGESQAATQQQALAIDPVGLAEAFDDAFGDPLGAMRIATGVQQQGELVAAQARQAVAVLHEAAQAVDHLQDQAVAALVAEGIVDVTEVVQVEVAEHQARPVEFAEARREQGLEALAVGDAGQRILLGEQLQGRLQTQALARVAQAAAQAVLGKLFGGQPVDHPNRRLRRLLLQQQDHRPGTGSPQRQAGRRGQEQPRGSAANRVAAPSQVVTMLSEKAGPSALRRSPSSGAQSGVSARRSRRKGSAGADKQPPKF